MIRWFWSGKKPTHFPYRPAHRVCLREHGPDVPAAYFFTFPLQVVAAERFGRAEPESVHVFVLQESRN